MTALTSGYTGACGATGGGEAGEPGPGSPPAAALLPSPFASHPGVLCGSIQQPTGSEAALGGQVSSPASPEQLQNEAPPAGQPPAGKQALDSPARAGRHSRQQQQQQLRPLPADSSASAASCHTAASEPSDLTLESVLSLSTMQLPDAPSEVRTLLPGVDPLLLVAIDTPASMTEGAWAWLKLLLVLLPLVMLKDCAGATVTWGLLVQPC